MKKTVGRTDRALRVALAVGAVVVSGLIGFASAWGIVLLVVAAILVVTAMSGYCPLYSILGIRTTCAVKSASKGSGASHLHQTA